MATPGLSRIAHVTSFARVGLLGLCLLAALPRALAEPPPAYRAAARAAGIPPLVLYAIALQESGIRLRGELRPWPWTLNLAGQPRRFASRAPACRALLRALQRGDARRVDAGLAQINLGYHGQRFASPCAALDPRHNLAVAADLLRQHRHQTGDWVLAAGHYHRPAGGAPAARYRRHFARHLARLQGVASLTAPRVAPGARP